MNYCSISDAWGINNNNIENVEPHNNKQNYIELDSNNQQHAQSAYSTIEQHLTESNVEQFKPNSNEMRDTSSKPYFMHAKEFSCDDFLEHINNCHHCNRKMKLKYKSTFLNNFQNNKDTCILILVAIFVYLFFKLLNRL